MNSALPPPPPPSHSPQPEGSSFSPPAAQAAQPNALSIHFKRVFFEGMRSLRPTEAELPMIHRAGISDPLMQGYAAFRHSLLWLAAPLAATSAVLAAIDLKDVELDSFNGLGKLAQLAPTIAVWILAAATIVALLNWSTPAKSARILVAGWAASIILPVVAALCPIDWLLKDGVEQANAGQMPLIRLFLGVGYAINLLPTVLSFPSGIIRGATRIKSMLPTSTVSGWSLMVLAPMYSMFFVIAMIVIAQVAGNPLLVIGTLLVAASPFIHMRARGLYVQALTDDERVRRLGSVQQRAAIVSLVGTALIVLWALTAKFGNSRVVGTADGDMLNPVTAVLRIVELFARLLITTAVFSHVILQMTETHWRHERQFHNSPDSVTYEGQMAAIERTLRATGDQLT